MALDSKKITSYTDNVKSLSDYPSDDGITAAQLKAIFDGRTDKEVKSAINGIIDELTATTGAAQIGTADGKTVQAALDSKVSAQAGKGLSTNDYTTAEKQKLSAIAAGATKTIVDAALSATSTNPVQNKVVNAALDAKANVTNPQFSGDAVFNADTPFNPSCTISLDDSTAKLQFTSALVPVPEEIIFGDGNLSLSSIGTTYKVYTENNKPPVDTALSSTSTNPVQNKAVHSALAEKANIDTPWFSGDAVFSGGTNTTFNPKYKVLLSDNTAKLQFSSDISPIPDGLVFGDGSLKFLTDEEEYAVYTEGNPPNGASPIDPATVRDIFRCAMTYTNNKDSFTFTSSGNGTLFDADFSAAAPKIDCSSLMMAWVMGIPYEYSKYAGKDNIKHYGYGLDLPANPYASDRPNRYYTHELAHYFNDRGWCFKPNENYSNIAPGDIIFVSFANGDGQSEFHDSAYMKIDHCLLVLGYKDATHLTCLHTSALYTLNFFDVPILPSDYDSTSTSNYNNAIKLVARLPFRRSCGLTQTPVITDATENTTTSTTNGLLATLTLSTPLKKNTPYTLIAHLENAATQTAPSANNYFGIRAAFQSGASDATIFSWQRNVNPKDNLYRCYFSVEDDPITQLKLYVLSTNVAGHKYKFCGLFEGLVAPTPNSDGTFN